MLPVEDERFIARGQPAAEVARVTGYSPPWVRPLARRYNQGGAAAVLDRRHQHPGRQFLLTLTQPTALAQALILPGADDYL